LSREKATVRRATTFGLEAAGAVAGFAGAAAPERPVLMNVVKRVFSTRRPWTRTPEVRLLIAFPFPR